MKNKDQLKRTPNNKQTKSPKAITRQQPTESSAANATNEFDFAALWSSEVEQLTSREFSSIREAIEVIADCVLAKAQGGQVTQDQRDMLITLFETDPELQEEIAKLCTIAPR